MTHTTRVRLITLRMCLALFTGTAAAQTSPAPAPFYVEGATIYTAPDQAPLRDAIVVVENDRIVAVGPRDGVAIPRGARRSPCSGGVITAGFQNSHVHLLGPEWKDAATQPAARLNRPLRAMLTRYGFTTVVDTGSDPNETLAVAQRIERGEVVGPRVLSVGLPVFPPNGIPAYLDHLPASFLAKLPQPANAGSAVQVVDANVAAGAMGTKLFLVTPQRPGLARMSPEVARAAADATHGHGKLVFAHPTDVAGVEAALAAHVDILAHTTHGVLEPWPEALLARAVKQHLSMIPTLQLMGYELKKEHVPTAAGEPLIAASVEQVRAYAAAGGEILFGTDVGYMRDFDPTEEYVLLARAGLGTTQILASLTTTPAARFHDAERGRVATGQMADLVVLDADPASGAENFARVKCTFRSGTLLYRQQRTPN